MYEGKTKMDITRSPLNEYLSEIRFWGDYVLNTGGKKFYQHTVTLTFSRLWNSLSKLSWISPVLFSARIRSAIFFSSSLKVKRLGRTKKFRGHVLCQGGGVYHPPTKKVYFFQPNVAKYSACSEKPFLFKLSVFSPLPKVKVLMK